VNGGGYEGAEAFGRRTFGILGKGSILRAGTVFSVWGLIFFWFGVWVDCYRGAPGCWEFWARGPGILTESWS
jgi:hypothetical protein